MNVHVSMFRSYQCAYCETHWPCEWQYERCPICREPTMDSYGNSITHQAAAQLAREMHFGWYLWERGLL